MRPYYGTSADKPIFITIDDRDVRGSLEPPMRVEKRPHIREFFLRTESAPIVVLKDYLLDVFFFFRPSRAECRYFYPIFSHPHSSSLPFFPSRFLRGRDFSAAVAANRRFSYIRVHARVPLYSPTSTTSRPISTFLQRRFRFLSPRPNRFVYTL